MTKIDIVSGFLGAGKTTLINRLIHEAYPNEQIVLIENEFGEIGIDGGFLQDSGVKIAEMNSGCICCSLVGDFSKSLQQVIKDYHPDRILIEPSGVGKLSDVTRAVLNADLNDAELNSAVVVVDVNKCKMYMKNFGEFFNDQIVHAGCIIFSHTDKTTEQKLKESLALIREKNQSATAVTTPIAQLPIQTLLESMENKHSLAEQLNVHVCHDHEDEEEDTCPVCGHHHDHGHEHHHEHDDCEHHHEHDECEHHHEHCECDHDHHHEHEHEHEHNHEHCDCHHEHHHDHHHHHADEVFTSWGKETLQQYSEADMKSILTALENSEVYGFILRAKGIVKANNDQWIHFDYVPGEPDVRFGTPSNIGKICVIGSHIHEDAIQALFDGIKE